VLISFWSSKGGSGTSVVAAAVALTLARESRVRLVDLRGDQPAVLALAGEPTAGVGDWLRAGPTAPADALERLSVDVGPRLSLLPLGAAHATGARPEAGAALAVALRDEQRITIVDAGAFDVAAGASAVDALVEVADVSIVVLRSCYLALRRAVRLEHTSRAAGAVLLEESGRALASRDVADVLGVPVLTTLPVRGTVSRAVDAGLLATRLPDALVRPIRQLAQRLTAPGGERAA
jgi:MinD superfamily P-loop ATPase